MQLPQEYITVLHSLDFVDLMLPPASTKHVLIPTTFYFNLILKQKAADDMNKRSISRIYTHMQFEGIQTFLCLYIPVWSNCFIADCFKPKRLLQAIKINNLFINQLT